MCKNIGIEFVASTANDHEANGLIESANRVLLSFFRRLRAFDQQSSINNILVEATYGKNICRGQKRASSFELLYGTSPRVMDGYGQKSNPVTVQQQASHTAKQRLHKRLRIRTQSFETIKPGDFMYFWRDQ